MMEKLIILLSLKTFTRVPGDFFINQNWIIMISTTHSPYYSPWRFIILLDYAMECESYTFHDILHHLLVHVGTKHQSTVLNIFIEIN